MTAEARVLAAVALLAGVAAAQGAPLGNEPYVGYVCAAGARQGATVRVEAGGRNLRGASAVLVSGAGVRAAVVRHGRTPWLLGPDERQAVARRLRRLAAGRRPGAAGAEGALPDHPMLSRLESMTGPELRRVAHEFLDPERRAQASPQISEVVEIEVAVDAGAEPGDRELRIRTPQGLSNPVLFQVGRLPELREEEPNDFRTAFQPVALPPFVCNGQVSFKDVDRFRFRGRAGQDLVVEVQARRLVPYIADAVPGWFQATLAIRDAAGREIAFADDHRFDPDPVLRFEVPRDGEYVLEIRDAIDRGREDFVYRATVAERPYVLAMFPLGGSRGRATEAVLGGWNLTLERVRLDTRPGPGAVRSVTWTCADLLSNVVAYAVGDLPELREAEPNDAGGEAQPIVPPVVVNGRIDRAGDTDRFRFRGRAGQEIVAEVSARRLGSPLDSLLRLTDGEGRVVAWNDDHEDRGAGLVTHQADSYLRARLPASGTYFVRVSDAQGGGGEAHAYRLRVSAPRPDFRVVVTPASVNVPAGGIAAVTVHAVREDGFDGEIRLSLEDAPGLPKGLRLSGARIPAGQDRVRMTIAAPPLRAGEPFALPIVGHARIDRGRNPVRRAAIPAEDRMQAFGLRHLVPARELLADVTRSWPRALPPHLDDTDDDRPARIPAGGTARVDLTVPAAAGRGRAGNAGPPVVRFQLSDPPDGVTLRSARLEKGRLSLVLGAERGKAAPGLAGNLIVEAQVEFAAPPDPKGAPSPPRTATVLLPAIPFVVVGR